MIDKWEDDLYLIIDQPNKDIPVYTVKKENGEGRIRTLHRNLLLPVGYISQRVQPSEPPTKPKPAPRSRFRSKQLPPPESSSSEESDYEDESSDEDVIPAVLVFNDQPVVSDIPEQQDIPSQQPEQTESLGDAQPAGASSMDSSLEDEGSASDESDAENEEVAQVQEPQLRPVSPPAPLHREDSPVPPRRSTRTRTEPNWMRSGEYISKSAVDKSTDWKDKANFLVNIMQQGLFTGLEKQAGEAIISVITDKT